ncbi:MAG: hypothetical protein ABIJ48_01805 [Actinomycetota bacterium]
MKSRSPMGAGVIVALVLLAAGLALFLLRPGSTGVGYDEGPVFAPPEDGTAVVSFLRESGGISLLGLRITDSTHYAEVQFITEPGCSGLLDSGDPWPTPYPQCSSPAEMVGEVGGLGIAESGRSLVGVQIKVPRGCYERLEPGMAWPSDLPECSFGN